MCSRNLAALGELRSPYLFIHIPGDRTLGVDRFIVHRKNEHRQGGISRANVLQEIEAIGARSEKCPR